MTLTRKYYDTLLDLFAQLAKTDSDDQIRYFQVKKSLKNVIERIYLFNLFTLSFSASFKTYLSSENTLNLKGEQMLLLNELNFELTECLHTTRLRFGGELIPYLFKIRLAMLSLSIADLDFLHFILKFPENGFANKDFVFVSEEEKLKEIKALKEGIKKNTFQKRKVNLKIKDYNYVQNQLQKHISSYKSYIFENYPSISNWFGLYNKRIRAYITEGLSADTFEFRLQAYMATNGDNSVTVLRQYYDFYPAYFSNLEEISDKQATAMVLSLPSETMQISNLFSPERIHQELIRLFINNTGDEEIQKLTVFLMKCQHYLFDHGPTFHAYFDLIATLNNQKYAIKIFHHASRDTASIQQAFKKINLEGSVKALFIFSTFPGELLVDYLKENNIIHLFLSDLYQPHFRAENSELIHWYIQSRLPYLQMDSETIQANFGAEELIYQLERCSPGEKDWSAFETLGIKIFEFLFADHFKTYLSDVQVENDLKSHRRDLLVNNNPKDAGSFWAEVKTQYNCSAIIIDFKNYSKPLNADELFSVTKYMNPQLGNFALLFCRKGVDQTASIQQRQLFQSQKLILAFSDQELIEMIREKMAGKDPIDRFESKKFNLVKSV